MAVTDTAAAPAPCCVTAQFCTCSSLDGKKYNAKLVCDKTLLGQTIAATM